MNLIIESAEQVAIVINKTIVYLGEHFGDPMADADNHIDLIQGITGAHADYTKLTLDKPISVDLVIRAIFAHKHDYPQPECSRVTLINTSVNYSAIFVDEKMVFLTYDNYALCETLAYGVALAKNAPLHQRYISAQSMIDRIGKDEWTVSDLIPFVEDKLKNLQ